jgi:hypothetical protein
MNTANMKVVHDLMIDLLLVFGVISLAATGGCGSSDSETGFVPEDNPTLAITMANGESVSATVISSIGVSFEFGEMIDGDLLSQAAGNPANLSGLKYLGPLYGKLTNSPSQALQSCSSGGTVDITITAQNPDTLTVGDRIVAIFSSCDDNLGYSISGTIDMTISVLGGDLGTDVFTIGLDTSLTDIIVTDGGDTMSANGRFTLLLDSVYFPSIAMSVRGDELQFGDGVEMITLTDFDHALTVDTGVTPDIKLANALGRLRRQSLGGTVDYETSNSIEAVGDFDPHTGTVLVSGADDSTVRIVIVDNTTVTLEIDTNGDGVIDEYVDTTWAALNGESTPDPASTINSASAPIVAREVFNAVTGFGSVTLTAGNQFTPSGVFGQVQLMAVSGSFGPLTVNCVGSGVAEVSGSVATSGTFTASDQLDATFMGCTRSNEILDGSLDVTVSSYVQSAGDAYRLTGVATQTDLRRFTGGSCFIGSGSFDTTYDHMYSMTGLVQASSTANMFTISAGGRGQVLSNASVTGDVSIGQPFATVSRSSSGSVTSDDLAGNFDYESIVADVFIMDEDPATGPFTGELLVTAADNSAMLMVALDEFNLRLDIDADGDSTVDDQIMTTWAQLGYGNVWNMCEL